MAFAPGPEGERDGLRGGGAGEQLIGGEVQFPAQGGNGLEVGAALVRFPLGDSLVGDAQPVGQLLLGQVFALAGGGDAPAHGLWFHTLCLAVLQWLF